MKLGDNTIRDLDVDSLVSIFPVSTEVGREALRVRLQSPISESAILLERQAEVKALRLLCKANRTAIDTAIATLKDCEADVVSVGAATSDKRLMEYYTQILWASDSIAAPLNHRGWLTELVVFFRTILLPGLTVILPLFVLIAPFLLYHFILKQELTTSTYFDLLQGSIKKALPSVLGAPRFVGKGGFLEMGEQFAHVAVAFVMFGFSAWSQVSSALSMRGIVADMRKRANSVVRFTEAVKNLQSIIGKSGTPLPEWSLPEWSLPEWSDGPLGVFGDAWNDATRIHRLVEIAGQLDMLIAVASQKRICFPVYDASALHIQDLYHPGLQQEKRVYNTVTMNDKGRRHVLLTGPNRGGKSTLLKAIGSAVLMSQTLGIVFGRKASLPIFESIVTALSPADTLGKLSLFEAEIEFAKNVKALALQGGGPLFLMMDEIFHGTNAHDGVEASEVFLDELYDLPAPIYSIVSTHYMSLPDRYGSAKTQNLCMEASIDPADPDRLVYTYRLRPGKNGHSSVREILRERGLLLKMPLSRPDPVKKVSASE
jgi:energy-coupling factor transporter ATP-binding protein EcfA2